MAIPRKTGGLPSKESFIYPQRVPSPPRGGGGTQETPPPSPPASPAAAFPRSICPRASTQMGCGGSKLEADEDTVEGLRPARRRIEEIRKLRFHGARIRKGSSVSTTKLLPPEDEETMTDDEASHGDSLRSDSLCNACRAPSSPSPQEGKNALHSPPTMTTPPPVVNVESRRAEKAEKAPAEGEKRRIAEEKGEEKEKEGEEKGTKPGQEVEQQDTRKDNRGDREQEGKGGDVEPKGEAADGEKRAERVAGALIGGGRGRLDDEELPRSPSFRVYFVDSVHESSDDDSVNARMSISGGKTDQKEKPGRKDGIKTINSGESEGKSTKKHRATRLKALTKGPSAVYGLLNVRSCYSHNSNGHPSSHENPRPVHSMSNVRPCNSNDSSYTTSNENPAAPISETVG